MWSAHVPDGKPKNNTGYQGVHNNLGNSKRQPRYEAKMKLNNRNVHIGQYSSAEEASVAYVDANLFHKGVQLPFPGFDFFAGPEEAQRALSIILAQKKQLFYELRPDWEVRLQCEEAWNNGDEDRFLELFDRLGEFDNPV